jgi:hypothetical protein|tara:strand:+ start:5866 stop:6105 length:240 start_codon:yes stop_codon:yes gene_type:complete
MTEKYIKSVPHYKDKKPGDPTKYSGAGATDIPIKEIDLDEMQDILKSVGAFDEQVKKEKESGTNTYAQDNQKIIKELKA